VAANPFVPITCSAIPESLLESELFGHVKGSFTGAIADKAGLFQQADRGTAFLDEIGELTPIIQTKLLRVLQEREFMPVGSTRTRQVNVRIIAATNRVLEQEIISGRFREDLYYRLAVVPIRVPPLRERIGDVPLLVDHFLRKYSTLLGKEVQTISSYGMEVLMQYDFPGNVRELENIIERGVALESSNIILPENLILSLHRQEKTAPARPADSNEPLFVAARDERELFERGLEEVLQRVEKEMILHALARADNSKMRAADLLKLSFRSLRYKTKKHSID
jgi:two-component system response regulator PilR (NtrC family)